MAAFSYIQFEKIMPLCETQEPTIEQVFACYSREEIQIHFLGSEYPVLFELMAKSRRFGSTKILDWRAITDEKTNIQFAALHLGLNDGSRYIAYRGTDDTIVGWKEDFCMGQEVVSAQLEAVAFFERVVAPELPYRIGGNSTGGHLALYIYIKLMV